MRLEPFRPVHRQVLIRAYTDLGNVYDTDAKRGDILKDMLVLMVERLGMVPVTAPQVAYVDAPGNKGFTGSINLATSHIAFHHWEETGLLMADVYSCKDFDSNIPLRTLTGFFGALRSVSLHTFDRLDVEKSLKKVSISYEPAHWELG